MSSSGRWLLAGALSGLLLTIPARAEHKILDQTTVVHVEEGQSDGLYAFFAAVPTSIHHRGDDVFQGLLVSDQTEVKANTYLLADWAAYTAAGRGSRKSRLVLVGDIPEASCASLSAGLPGAQSVKVKGADVPALALALARTTFKSSPHAVLAPYVANPTDADAQGLANAAVYASTTGSPLVYAPDTGVTPDIAAALGALGVSRVTVFDLTGRFAPGALDPLTAAQVAVAAHVTDVKAAVTLLNTTGDKGTVCLMQDKWMGLGASVAAARYKGVVLTVPTAVTSAAVKAYRRIPSTLLTTTEKLSKPFSEADEPVANSLGQLATTIYATLADVGAENPDQLETVINFSQGNQFSGVPLTLERALVGDPSRPKERGALVSRMPGSPIENVAYINRTTLYRGLVTTAPRPKRVSMMMVAYEAQNTTAACTLDFKDWTGKQHKVNEFFGVHDSGFDDPGAYVNFKARGYDVGFHNGPQIGAVTDPVNNEPTYGFTKELRDGTTFFYVSCHGSTDAFYPLDTDAGICADLPWGEASWPTRSGRVNKSGPAFDVQDVDATLENLHSMVGFFNACLVGGGKINKTLMDHGAAGVISSYISVSFNGAGLYACDLMTQLGTDGVSIGEAYAHAMSLTSECFPRGQVLGDSSLRFVLFGDARMEYAKPGWTRPEPIEANAGRLGGSR